MGFCQPSSYLCRRCLAAASAVRASVALFSIMPIIRGPIAYKLCAPSHDAHPQTARSTSFFTHHLRLISLAVVVGTRRPPAPRRPLEHCSGAKIPRNRFSLALLALRRPACCGLIRHIGLKRHGAHAHAMPFVCFRCACHGGACMSACMSAAPDVLMSCSMESVKFLVLLCIECGLHRSALHYFTCTTHTSHNRGYFHTEDTHSTARGS